jgi:hypothetical protein
MVRLKKPIDYVNGLRLSSDPETRKLGESSIRMRLPPSLNQSKKP